MLTRRIQAWPRKLWGIAKTTFKKTARRTPGIRRIGHLFDRMTILEQSLAVLRTSIHAKLAQHESRVRQFAQPAYAHQSNLERSDRPDANGLTMAGLEFLLVHARLPAPGGRILDAAGIFEHGGIDLTSLGYDIERGTFETDGSRTWNTILCRLKVGTDDAGERFVADALQSLRPGGLLILSAPLPAGAESPAWLIRLPAREMIHAHRDDAMWRFSPIGMESARRGESLIVCVMERPEHAI